MIRFTKGNLLTANAEALVNTVNTVGVMGKGIALQFKEEFPENFAIYADACKSGGSYIQGFEQMNATAFEPLTMHYSRINEVSSYVRTLDKTEQDSLKETIRLISGFESTPALEVLASVDFIRHNNPGISLEDTIAAIHNWSERKNKLFKNEYIQIAYDHLDTFYGESKLSAGNSSSDLPEYSEP